MSAFSLRLRTRQGCPISPVLFNIISEVLASSVTGEKRKKRGGGGGEWKRNESYADWKGRDNSAHIHKWYDYLCIMSQSQSIYKKLLLLINVEKELATHSSILVWRIPWTEEPGSLQFMGSHRVRHDWSNLAH